MIFKNRLCLVFILALFSCGSKQEEGFIFIQLCDPQLGMVAYEHDKSTFQQAVTQINDLKPDFVLICGDMVHHASDVSFNDFLTIKEKLNMPSYVVPGNHDIGLTPTDSTLAYYREKFSDDYYNFVHRGYSFIAVNTQLWKTNISPHSLNHDNWFREILEEQKKNKLPQIVFGHYPVFTDSIKERNHYFNIDSLKRKELIQLFVDNDVRAYLSGHKHELVINKEYDILFVSGESTSKNFDKRPLGFRKYVIKNDRIIHTFIPLDTSKMDWE